MVKKEAKQKMAEITQTGVRIRRNIIDCDNLPFQYELYQNLCIMQIWTEIENKNQINCGVRVVWKCLSAKKQIIKVFKSPSDSHDSFKAEQLQIIKDYFENNLTKNFVSISVKYKAEFIDNAPTLEEMDNETCGICVWNYDNGSDCHCNNPFVCKDQNLFLDSSCIFFHLSKFSETSNFRQGQFFFSDKFIL